MPRSRIAYLLAVVIFAVLLLLQLVSWPVDPKLDADLLVAGLLALAVGFVV